MLVPPDFETYRKYSRALMEILSGYTPLLQQVSIDEAYMDVTEQVAGAAGGAGSCSADRSAEDTEAPAAAGSAGDSGVPGSIKSPSRDCEHALALAQQIRDRVRTQLGFTVNVGISSNKLLAKMASDFEKPDKTHTLYPEEVPAKMWPLPIGALHGCGKSTAQKLQLIGINTIGDAAAADLALLQSFLGQNSGTYIWNSSNGISRSKVVAEREQAKSVSNERTLSEDISRENYRTDGVPVISMLARKVAGRLQKSGLSGQTVTFQIKTSEFERHSRQMSLPDLTDRAKDIEADRRACSRRESAYDLLESVYRGSLKRICTRWISSSGRSRTKKRRAERSKRAGKPRRIGWPRRRRKLRARSRSGQFWKGSRNRSRKSRRRQRPAGRARPNWMR